MYAYAALAGLGLSMKTRLFLNSQRPTCFWRPSWDIKAGVTVTSFKFPFSFLTSLKPSAELRTSSFIEVKKSRMESLLNDPNVLS